MSFETDFFSLLEIARYSVRKSPAVPGTPDEGPCVEMDDSIVQRGANTSPVFLESVKNIFLI